MVYISSAYINGISALTGFQLFFFGIDIEFVHFLAR